MGNLMYGSPRFGFVFTVAAVLLFTTACSNTPDVSGSLYWKPPFAPIQLGVDTHGNISANVSSSQLITPVGTFSVGATAETQGGPPPIPENHVRLRFRDRDKGVDVIRDVAVGDVPYEIYLKGEARLTVSNEEVVVDISEASCVQIIRAGNTEDLGCDASGSGMVIDNEGTGLKGISIGSRVTVTSVELNIRTAPGTDASVITKVKRGTRLEVVDGPASVPTTSDDGRPMFRIWWKVSGWDNGERLGWSSSRYLEPAP
jgi:hypothetical protein